jgi:hypothetical protein
LISPNFFAKPKVVGARRLAKNSPFNFTEDSVTEILNQNLAKICRMPFPKKGVQFCAQMWMKLTSGVLFSLWWTNRAY